MRGAGGARVLSEMWPVALFAVPFMRRTPSIVSLDATPINYDSVGVEYGHQAGNKNALERRKQAWNRATFHAAIASCWAMA